MFPSAEKTLYIYVDESGNFVFSPKGTQFLVFTAISTRVPFEISSKMYLLKYDLLRGGLKKGEANEDLACFNASENKQRIRDSVFDLIKKGLDFEIDAVVVEKQKAHPSLQDDMPRFYKKICGCLINYILRRNKFGQLIIITDRLPHKQKREAITKGLKEASQEVLSGATVFRLYHLPSISDFCLQVVDYCSWAIYRKWGNWGDVETRPYLMIRDKIRSEFDIFKQGSETFYEKGSINNDPPN